MPTRHFPPDVKSVLDLIRLCSRNNMKESAQTFCQLLHIFSVEEISQKMSGFQIGLEKEDKVEVKEGSFYMAIFLFVFSLVVQHENEDIDSFTILFKGKLCKELAMAFFEDETCEVARENKHRNLFLLLTSDNEEGVRVKIFN